MVYEKSIGGAPKSIHLAALQEEEEEDEDED
jgi:hypothetical protein